MGVHDMEREIHDPDVWHFICRCINGGEDATAEIDLPAGEG
jgi:hypothetical protein